jgi:hypothetical protein
MRRETNDCVGCETCVHCGRGRNYVYYECDSCGAESYDSKIYSDGSYHYCLECLLRIHMADFNSDMLQEHGEEWANDNYFQVVQGD